MAVIALAMFTASVNADCGRPPANYKAMATNYLKSVLKDPYSAKIQIVGVENWNAGIIPVHETPEVAVEPCWAVIAFVNAKNSFGAYTGTRKMVVWMLEDQVINAVAMP